MSFDPHAITCAHLPPEPTPDFAERLKRRRGQRPPECRIFFAVPQQIARAERERQSGVGMPSACHQLTPELHIFNITRACGFERLNASAQISEFRAKIRMRVHGGKSDATSHPRTCEPSSDVAGKNGANEVR
jgi:hypothetical protein